MSKMMKVVETLLGWKPCWERQPPECLVRIDPDLMKRLAKTYADIPSILNQITEEWLTSRGL